MSATSGADFIRVVCSRCDDFRRVAAPPGTKDANGETIRTVVCPRCGTDEQRRELFKQNKGMPEIRSSDLDKEEQDLFRMWRAAGHHELDCLRWIEGRRYDPSKDDDFLAEVEAKLAVWRAARDAETRHPCIQCGYECNDARSLYCSDACAANHKAKKPFGKAV